MPLTLQHRPILRGGNINEKYRHTPNFSSIGQLEAELLNFVPNLDHIFGPSCGALGHIPIKLEMYSPILSILSPKLWEEFDNEGIKSLILYKVTVHCC